MPTVATTKNPPKVVEAPLTTYPLNFEDLQSGHFAECENGTVVFVGRGPLDHNNPLNIENGIGGYGPKSGEPYKFRYLTDHTITVKL